MAESRESKGFSLDRLLGNPELITGLLSLFGSRWMGESHNEESEDPRPDAAEAAAVFTDTEADSVAEELPLLSEAMDETTAADVRDGRESVPAAGVPSVHEKGRGRKREMLCALKPYMSRSRCDMVDRILHAADLVDLFRR